MVKNWRVWLGLGVSLLFLAVLLYSVDLTEVLASLREANYLYVVPGIAVYFVAVYFRAVRWRYLLSGIGDFPATRLYPVVVIGYMVNNLLPVRLGELARSYYLSQREEVSASSGLATIAVERVYDGLVLLAFAALTAPALLSLGQFDPAHDAFRTGALVLAPIVIVMVLGALAVLTLASSPKFLRLVGWMLKLAPPRVRPKAEELVGHFIGGLGSLRSPRRQLAVFALSLPVWLFEGATYVFIGYSFGISDYFESFGVLLLVMLLVTATSNLAAAMPASVGGIGPFEVVAQQTLVVLGVGPAVGAVYAGFLHLVALWLPVNLVGLVLLWRQHLSLAPMVRPGREESRDPLPGYGAVVPHPSKEEAP